MGKYRGCMTSLDEQNLTPQMPTPENDQTHSKKSSAVADKLGDYVWPFWGVGT